MEDENKKIDLEKEAENFEVGKVKAIGFPVKENTEAVLTEIQKKREEAIPKIYRFLSKLGQDLWDLKKIQPHHIETAHDIHAIYTVKPGNQFEYVEISNDGSFNFSTHKELQAYKSLGNMPVLGRTHVLRGDLPNVVSIFPTFSNLRSCIEHDGRYIHVQAYPGFSFPPYCKEGEICLAACYHTEPRDHITGEKPSICLGWLANQNNYSFEKTKDLAEVILKSIGKIEKK